MGDVVALKKASWDTDLLKNKQGAYLPCLNNAVLILAHRKEWHGVIAYDAFAGVVVKKRKPPWSDDTAPEDDEVRDWTRKDSSRASVWIAREYNCSIPTSIITEAVDVVADRWIVHPVRDWLGDLIWDKKPRIDDFLVRLACAEDTAYVRAATKNFFISAVARIFKPGEQVDTMLILEGKTGVGKSSLFRILASDEWFLDSAFDMGSKDGYQILRRKWIVEMGELAGFSRSEDARRKAFISSVKDTYRPSYGHAPVDFLRQCVFAGTFNPDGAGYNKDVTGDRRSQPVVVGNVDRKAVRGERTQLWSEAVARYRRGESWHLLGSKLIRAAAEEAEERRQADPWEMHVAEFLRMNGALYRKLGIRIEDLLTDAIEMPKDRQSHSDRIRMGRALHVLGWHPVRSTDGARRYKPVASNSKKEK